MIVTGRPVPRTQSPRRPPPQEAEYQDDMTWEDYKTVPGTDWANPSLQPTIEKWKVAIVLTEFADQPLNITMPAGATIFGNPQTTANSIPRAQAAQFYEDFLNTPSLLNHFTTMKSYWMETSLGRYGVELEAYGPYTLTGNQWEYWLRDAGNAGSACPTGFTCNRNARTEVRALWEAAAAPFACRRIVERRRPDVVLGAGGYVAGPMVLAARTKGVPAALMASPARVRRSSACSVMPSAASARLWMSAR